MKASVLIKTIQEIMKLNNNDPDIYYSRELGGDNEFSINSIGYSVNQIILCNEDEPND
jgi:hypothetical protein